MVDSSFIAIISSICAVLNCAYISSELYFVGNGYVRSATIFNLVTAAVSALSLGSDILLLISVNFGNTEESAITGNDSVPSKILKRIRLALCVKAFVITLEFFMVIFDGYNCAQDCVRYMKGSHLKWQDYLKANPPEDSVQEGGYPIAMSVIVATIATTVKGLMLFLIHDFYEGVKQQGTLACDGLEDFFEKQEPGVQANQQQILQAIPGFYPAGGMVVPGAPMQVFYPVGGMAAPGAPMVTGGSVGPTAYGYPNAAPQLVTLRHSEKATDAANARATN